MTGVMPKTFHFPAPGVDLWLGTAMSQSTAGTLEAHYLKVVGRLKPGISYQQASADIDAVATRMQEQYPKTNRYVSASINPLYEQQVGDVRPALLMLFVASAFVLLIACANVANLLLARAATRQKEIAIRLALGSGRFRLTRQLITESLLLAAIGGIFGLQIGFWGLKALSSLTPTNLIPQTPISMNGKLMGFTILASLLTGLIFGLVPAIQATKTDLNETLKDTGRDSVSGGRTKLRSLLVVAELALALILMVGAGLMMNSYLLLNSVDTGLKTKNVLTLKASPPYSKYPDIAQRAAFYDQILDRIQALPNVESAAVINGLPMSDDLGEMTYFPEGPNPPKVFNALPRTVSTTYFQTLGIPILRGRSFIPQDNANVPIVLVVNESMAKLCWPGEDPIGKRIHVGIMAAPLVTVVGVVKDTHSRLGEPPRPQVFQSYAQSASFAPGDLIVKAKSDPLSIVAAVRDAVWQVDKDQPVSSIATMDSVMANSIARERFNMLLLSIFAGLALVLASIGIYGVMSYVVAHGTRELGIRLALGAQKHDILTLVIGKAMILSLTGVAIGTIGALLLTRLISKMIYGVKPTDPSTFVGVAVLLTAIAIIACYLPARRAIKIDPVVALRCE
jgi:putative ABC transport system permease protein